MPLPYRPRLGLEYFRFAPVATCKILLEFKCTVKHPKLRTPLLLLTRRRGSGSPAMAGGRVGYYCHDFTVRLVSWSLSLGQENNVNQGRKFIVEVIDLGKYLTESGADHLVVP